MWTPPQIWIVSVPSSTLFPIIRRDSPVSFCFRRDGLTAWGKSGRRSSLWSLFWCHKSKGPIDNWSTGPPGGLVHGWQKWPGSSRTLKTYLEAVDEAGRDLRFRWEKSSFWVRREIEVEAVRSPWFTSSIAYFCFVVCKFCVNSRSKPS